MHLAMHATSVGRGSELEALPGGRYPGGPELFRNLNFGIDMESRFAMVGPNGAQLT